MRKLEMRHLWGLLPFVFLILVTFGTPLRLLDFWWHLKAGEVIVSTHSIPQSDLFSFTATGTPFLLQSWLAEVLFFLTYRIGGLRLIVALNAFVLALALLAIYFVCSKWILSPRLRALVSVLLIIPLIIYSNVRPQVFSILLFALFLGLLNLERYWSRNVLWVLPPLMVLWVNLHGAFPLGLGLIGIFWLDAAIGVVANKEGQEGYRLKRLTFIGLVTTVATLVNPVGYHLYADVLSVLTNPPSQQFVTEWQAPLIKDWTGLLGFFVPFLATTLVFICIPGAGRLELILYLVFALFGFSALRNAIWFALVSPTLVARQLARLPSLSRAESVRQPARGSPGINLAFLILMLLLLVGASPWFYPTLRGKPLWEPATPAEAVSFIDREALSGRIFHPQIFGDFLIWRLWPRHQSFIDGRVHLFNSEVVRDYFAVFSTDRWEEILEHYGIRYLFLSKIDPDSLKLFKKARDSSGWHLIYEDTKAGILGRQVESAP